MDLTTTLSTFSILFIAEMGDKTQIATMVLAHRYRMLPVLMGAWLAFLVLNLLAVLVGESLLLFIPQSIILYCAGALFILFAYLSWRDANKDEAGTDTEPGSVGNAFITSFAMIFIAELGDKTQLAMVAMAASTGDMLSVFIGGSLALCLVALIGAALGSTVLKHIPVHAVHRAAALLFLVFGVTALYQGINT